VDVQIEEEICGSFMFLCSNDVGCDIAMISDVLFGLCSLVMLITYWDWNPFFFFCSVMIIRSSDQIKMAVELIWARDKEHSLANQNRPNSADCAFNQSVLSHLHYAEYVRHDIPNTGKTIGSCGGR